MPTSWSSRRVDPIDRAHLTGVSRPSPPIYRYAPSDHLAELVERYWIPVWSASEASTQSTLQHPVCLIVVSNTYARLYGVVRGRSSVTLEGDGWAVGTMLKPAGGRLVLGRSVADLTDRQVDLDELDSLDAHELMDEIRASMARDPHHVDAHGLAVSAMERRLEGFLPVDEPGLLINRVVAWLQEHPEVTRVAEVADTFALSGRSLQRLVSNGWD